MSLVSGTASGSNGCRKGDSGRSMWTPGFLPRHLGTRSGKTQKHQDLFAFCFLRFSQELISRELDQLKPGNYGQRGPRIPALSLLSCVILSQSLPTSGQFSLL